MKKIFPIALVITLGILFFLPKLEAQSSQCRGCNHAIPTEVLTSAKNAVTIAGPPDGKGDPVEYQIYTQGKGGVWKLEASGIVDKPGARETFKYYRPGQLMVLVFCKTPFSNMVEFSSIKVNTPASN